MKIMDERESLQMALQETEQVMQVLRAVNNDPAVVQLLVLKQCEAALHVVRSRRRSRVGTSS